MHVPHRNRPPLERQISMVQPSGPDDDRAARSAGLNWWNHSSALATVYWPGGAPGMATGQYTSIPATSARMAEPSGPPLMGESDGPGGMDARLRLRARRSTG